MKVRAQAALSAKGKLEPFEYDPGSLGPHQVDVSVTHCGICHTDSAMVDNERRVLEVARPLWAQAQGLVLRELGTKAWADAKRRLAHLLDVALENRGRRRAPPSQALRRTCRRTPAGG
jgi:NADPH:quinone reductase-like Zn-dependent oxidoreductase